MKAIQMHHYSTYSDQISYTNTNFHVALLFYPQRDIHVLWTFFSSYLTFAVVKKCTALKKNPLKMLGIKTEP